jgi:hypothetical protein
MLRNSTPYFSHGDLVIPRGEAGRTWEEGNCILAIFSHIRGNLGVGWWGAAPPAYSQAAVLWDCAFLIRADAIALPAKSRALRALRKVATTDADLLAELQAAQSELEAVHPSPEGEADWRGLSQALAAVISEFQVRRGLGGSNSSSKT